MAHLTYGSAICYSGYRAGQSPRTQVYPSYEEIKEDLLLLAEHFHYLRMYDPSLHAQTVLKVIRDNKLPLKVVLGGELLAEVYNPNCPWDKRVRSAEELAENKQKNIAEIQRVIDLAKEYQDIVEVISVGNENVSLWKNDFVPEDRLIEYVKMVKAQTNQYVTFCEGADGWRDRLDRLAQEVDIISIHSYPLWQRIPVDQALAANIRDYNEVTAKHKDKFIMFTEVGWATKTKATSMDVTQANEENQKKYLTSLLKWGHDEQIITFLFEAFDEPWKGSDDPLEPEKHWGIYDEKRRPKLFMQGK